MCEEATMKDTAKNLAAGGLLRNPWNALVTYSNDNATMRRALAP
jgi:hypothetical protein